MCHSINICKFLLYCRLHFTVLSTVYWLFSTVFYGTSSPANVVMMNTANEINDHSDATSIVTTWSLCGQLLKGVEGIGVLAGGLKVG